MITVNVASVSLRLSSRTSMEGGVVRSEEVLSRQVSLARVRRCPREPVLERKRRIRVRKRNVGRV
jgi:hypothetical protein